jgi:hypothetical protein
MRIKVLTTTTYSHGRDNETESLYDDVEHFRSTYCRKFDEVKVISENEMTVRYEADDGSGENTNTYSLKIRASKKSIAELSKIYSTYNPSAAV